MPYVGLNCLTAQQCCQLPPTRIEARVPACPPLLSPGPSAARRRGPGGRTAALGAGSTRAHHSSSSSSAIAPSSSVMRSSCGPAATHCGSCARPSPQPRGQRHRRQRPGHRHRLPAGGPGGVRAAAARRGRPGHPSRLAGPPRAPAGATAAGATRRCRATRGSSAGGGLPRHHRPAALPGAADGHGTHRALAPLALALQAAPAPAAAGARVAAGRGGPTCA